VRLFGGARLFAHAPEELRVEPREVLDAETPAAAGRDPERQRRRFQRDRPAGSGSRNGSSPVQPLRATIPAARFSRSGASPVSPRQPRFQSGSPDVSR
jgi:hypothetical protein